MVTTYKKPTIDYNRRRASMAIPDQSLSIREIVKRYVRGVPVDVVQRQAVYNDQSDYDMEKLSRMDFGQKAEYADELAAQARQMQSDLNEQIRTARDAKARAESDAKEDQDSQVEKPKPGSKATS